VCGCSRTSWPPASSSAATSPPIAPAPMTATFTFQQCDEHRRFLECFQNLWQTARVPAISELERMLRGASLRITRPRQ